MFYSLGVWSSLIRQHGYSAYTCANERRDAKSKNSSPSAGKKHLIRDFKIKCLKLPLMSWKNNEFINN